MKVQIEAKKQRATALDVEARRVFGDGAVAAAYQSVCNPGWCAHATRWSPRRSLVVECFKTEAIARRRLLQALRGLPTWSGR